MTSRYWYLQMDEQKLEQAMVNLQNGKGEALSEIYNITSRGVFTFVLPLLHDYQLAEDVMQDTYVACYNHIQDYKPGTNARNWLLTIAKNTAISLLKKKNREISYDFSEEVHPDGVYYLGEVDTPTITLANKILSEDEFNIVMMFAIGDYKHREIAEVMHLPLGTVTWKYNNAIKKIKKALEEDERKYERKCLQQQNQQG